jgi:hypothetical protein
MFAVFRGGKYDKTGRYLAAIDFLVVVILWTSTDIHGNDIHIFSNFNKFIETDRVLVDSS